MIPISFLSKMGVYEIEYQGVSVKTRVVDRAALVDTYVTELRSVSGRRVVGLDIKYSQSNYPAILLLCAGNRCLIIQLQHLDSVPDSLKKFLADETICFVGVETSQKVSQLGPYSIECKTAVEVGELTARVLKKPDLISCGLTDLARKAEINIEAPTGATGERPNWNAKVFSHEQIKNAIQDVYTSYVIGNKVLGML